VLSTHGTSSSVSTPWRSAGTGRSDRGEPHGCELHRPAHRRQDGPPPFAVPPASSLERCRDLGESTVAYPGSRGSAFSNRSIRRSSSTSGSVGCWTRPRSKAGRVQHRKIKTADFWRIYGERDEVCFLYSPRAPPPSMSVRHWAAARGQCSTGYRRLRAYHSYHRQGMVPSNPFAQALECTVPAPMRGRSVF